MIDFMEKGERRMGVLENSSILLSVGNTERSRSHNLVWEADTKHWNL